jgi:Icc protein
VIALVPLLLAGGLTVSGVVFDDANANGRRDAGEAGLAGVVVSDGTAVAATGADGTYTLEAVTARHVFVVTPGDRRAVAGWFQEAAPHANFALAPAPVGTRWRFAHLSDPHVWAENVDRLRRALSLAAARDIDCALVSGDLVLDALRAGEPQARAAFALYASVVREARFPVRTAIGNHDVFGIDRAYSHVPADHPAYGKALYEQEQGPRYSAFNRGRIHFIVLDTIGVDDTRYFGFLDPAQLAWIRSELQHVGPGTTVVTVGHIPLRSGALALSYAAEGLARTLMSGAARTSYRHIVRNADALAEILRPYRWTLALQGHTHVLERLAPAQGSITRYHTAPSVDERTQFQDPSGFLVYSVDGEKIDDGELIKLE